MEQFRIQKRLLELGVKITPQHNLVSVHPGAVKLECNFTDKITIHECQTLLLVTERFPNDDLHKSLLDNPEGIDQAGIKTIQCIGDCLAPGIIAAAVHSGHLAAREFEANVPEDIPFLRERILL
tara:strand:- start:259 stop:630 length:372 start_codon:yes stop_codon:yes gene_type:complete